MLQEPRKYKLWEILRLIDLKKVPKGTKFMAKNIPITLIIKYDGEGIVYHNLMGKEDSGYITLQGEIRTEYMWIKENLDV